MGNSNISEPQDKKSDLNISVESKDTIMTETMLKTFFNKDEIYQYTISISHDYKEFKEDVIHHLNFLDNVCAEGLKEKDVMALNGVRNYITSFLIRNNLIDYTKKNRN